ncbi:MAG: alpha/beta hydrolase [Proteobacteria bacterium]|nr:alpha/beta hydrolase [Pseudomonadota bacterium]
MISRLGLLILLALSLFITGFNGKVLRYQPSGLYTEFNYSEEHSYAYYRKDLREKLSRNWQELLEAKGAKTPAEVERIVELLAPTDKPPLNCSVVPDRLEGGRYRRGVLLIHGLYDSPYVMKDLEKFFNENCFYTRSILLPGHGTRPGDMLEISYIEWIKAVDFAVARFLDEVEDLYIAGFSTGAALAVRKAIKDPDSIKGLFLFAPSLKLRTGSAALLHRLGKKWVPWQRFDDDDFVKYESITLKSVIEVKRLADEVREDLEGQADGLAIPAMIVLSDSDYTIPAKETIRLFDEGRFGEKSRMIVYHRGDRPDSLPAQCYNPDASSGKDCRKLYYNSRFKYEMADAVYQISDYSHMSLTLPPDDVHYGLAGDYRYCLQYFFGWQDGLRRACKADVPAKVCLGERSAFGSQKYEECEVQGRVVRRLSSNPLFKEMTGQIGNFIDKLGTHVDAQ